MTKIMIFTFNLIFEPPFHPFQGNEAVHQSFIKLQLSYPVEKNIGTH